MHNQTPLEAAADQALTDSLPPTLKAVLARMHSRGLSREHILMCVQHFSAQAGGKRHNLVTLQCEAYLESLPPVSPRACCGE
jgi:hypothetical protein